MQGDTQSTKSEKQSSIAGRWTQKFACAFRGLALAVGHEDSFRVHLPAALAACGLAAWLGVTLAEWLVLAASITVVLTAELLNTAIERLARAVSQEEHPEIRNALDVGSAAVLVASLGASVVGVVILAWNLMAVGNLP